MSRRFFTSDWHLNYSDVISYSSRPFDNINKMNDVIINNCNSSTKNTDIIIHVGDFYCYGSDRGSDSIKESPNKYINKINANLVLIKGNHDKSNKIDYLCDSMMTSLYQYNYVHVGHHPSIDHNSRAHYMRDLINICGHVHNRWKYLYDEHRNILNINVGIDVWKYHPVSELKLCRYISRLGKLNPKINRLLKYRTN